MGFGMTKEVLLFCV